MTDDRIEAIVIRRKKIKTGNVPETKRENIRNRSKTSIDSEAESIETRKNRRRNTKRIDRSPAPVKNTLKGKKDNMIENTKDDFTKTMKNFILNLP